MFKCPGCFRTFMIGDEAEKHRRFEGHLPYCDGEAKKINKETRKKDGGSKKEKIGPGRKKASGRIQGR